MKLCYTLQWKFRGSLSKMTAILLASLVIVPIFLDTSYTNIYHVVTTVYIVHIVFLVEPKDKELFLLLIRKLAGALDLFLQSIPNI